MRATLSCMDSDSFFSYKRKKHEKYFVISIKIHNLQTYKKMNPYQLFPNIYFIMKTSAKLLRRISYSPPTATLVEVTVERGFAVSLPDDVVNPW